MPSFYVLPEADFDLPDIDFFDPTDMDYDPVETESDDPVAAVREWANCLHTAGFPVYDGTYWAVDAPNRRAVRVRLNVRWSVECGLVEDPAPQSTGREHPKKCPYVVEGAPPPTAEREHYQKLCPYDGGGCGREECYGPTACEALKHKQNGGETPPRAGIPAHSVK